MSVVGLQLKTTNDPTVELTQPKEGDIITPVGFNNFVTCQAVATEGIKFVEYEFESEYWEDDSFRYAGNTLTEPPYNFVYNAQPLSRGDWLKVRAVGFVDIGHGVYSGSAKSEWVTVSVAKSRSVTLFDNLLIRLPLLQKLLKL